MRPQKKDEGEDDIFPFPLLNGIEGTQSELVRAHGARRARYRGLDKVKLQFYLIGAACNVKRWLRRAGWEIKKAMQQNSYALASG